jgi:spore maturation protein CgeB
MMGYCPSGRLFEAAACGAAVLSDAWEGLDSFFAPGTEILVAEQTEDVLAAINRDPRELAQIGNAARMRVLEEHTSAHRAVELVRLLEGCGSRAAAPPLFIAGE